MDTTAIDRVSVERILAERRITAHFQPVLSLRRGQVLGLEALARTEHLGEMIPPALLFRDAERDGLVPQLDRMCWEAAVRSFAPLHQADPSLILFVNLHALSVDRDVLGDGGLLALLEANDVNPGNVALELLETEFANSSHARRSVRDFRDHGLLVVLDDVGVGHSNLDRIASIQPDMLKVDRTLISGLQHDFHKREVFKTLLNLSQTIGGWTIAEGIETEAEAITVLELGGDLLQGFFFGKPSEGVVPVQPHIPAQMAQVAFQFKHHMLAYVHSRRVAHQKQMSVLYGVVSELRQLNADEFDTRLAELVRQFPDVNSACILDERGVQVTETALSPGHVQRRGAPIYRPPVRGTDHSLKEYFYLLREMHLDPFKTQPYVPLPAGDLCITISTQFHDHRCRPYVLCLHLALNRG